MPPRGVRRCRLAQWLVRTWDSKTQRTIPTPVERELVHLSPCRRATATPLGDHCRAVDAVAPFSRLVLRLLSKFFSQLFKVVLRGLPLGGLTRTGT
jgi:hypothetical protein